MNSSLKCVYIFILLFSLVTFSKVNRPPLGESNNRGLAGMAAALQNAHREPDVLKAKEVIQNQKNFFTAISYSLFTPTFNSELLKKQNQESLGLSALFGYSYLPFLGWGFQAGLGVMQNSKTDLSLPDFILVKPSGSILFAFSQSIFFTGGIFNYIQQGQNLKNFQSYIGQEFFIGYRANKKINIKFGYSHFKFSSDFKIGESIVNSMVSVRGLESQLVYLF